MNEKEANIRIFQALIPVNKVLLRYPEDILILKSDEVSWLNEQIRSIDTHLASLDFKETDGDKKKTPLSSRIKEVPNMEERCTIYNGIREELLEIKQKLGSLVHSSEDARKRRFVKFGPAICGGVSDRQQIIDALEDACCCSSPGTCRIPLPENHLTPFLQLILDELVVPNIRYISSHPGVSENIQYEILEWIKKLDEKLSLKNPFTEEEVLIEEITSKTPSNVMKNLQNIRKRYNKVSNRDINFKSFQNKTDDTSGKTEKEREAYDKLLKELKSDLQNRKLQWKRKKIERMQNDFLQELGENLKKYKRIEDTFSSLCDDSGSLWDLSKGFFKKHGFEILKKYEKLLEKDKGLKKLAELIGKQSQLQKEYEIELRSKVTITSSYHPMPAYKGQVCGIKTSNDISTSLPSELALFHNPATKKLFELKFAQNQLLSFKYENAGTTTAEKEKKKGSCKGPVIICVDTSGSMNGTPEKIAKTITFALMKTARKEKRKCYLISFSTDIETLELSGESGNIDAEMDGLLEFLQMSFHGGTDVYPALSHALKMLKTENFRNADILVISDFLMGGLDEDAVREIESQKENKTDFYSLTIGSYRNREALSVFTRNWHYDLKETNEKSILTEIPTIVK